MNTVSWKSGLLLMALVLLIAGLQVTAISILGNLFQGREPALLTAATPALAKPAPEATANVGPALLPTAPAIAPAAALPAPSTGPIALTAVNSAKPAVSAAAETRPESAPATPEKAARTPAEPARERTATPPDVAKAEPANSEQAILTAPLATPVEPASLQDAAWFGSRDAKRFTVQVHSGATVEQLKDFARVNKLPEPLAYYRTLRNGKPSYNLVMGDYENAQAAHQAALQISASLPSLRPGIRDFAAIQAQLR